MPGFPRDWVVRAVIGLLLAAALAALLLDPGGGALSGHATAVDGDTIRVGAERVRLVGLDAPELAQTCRHDDGAEWACGAAARGEMARLLGAGDVACRTDGHDRYGRVLARCTAGDADLGGAVVRAGLAVADGDYLLEEASAQRARLGIWNGRFEAPREWRRTREGEAGPSLLDAVRSGFR